MKLKKEIFELIKNWCDTLLETQLDMPKEPWLDGAVLCPGCAIIHGRCADMILPLVLLYHETGNERYLTAAKKLVDWSEYNLVSKRGEYRNDPLNRWKGTNIFSCLAIGETLERFGDILDKETFNKWDNIFRNRANASIGFCESVNPHINYNAGAAAMFAFAYKYTGEQKFLDQALKQEKFCRAHFDSEGLFYGEGKPTNGTTQKGCHYIDMGYNLEESIPLLIMHSYWLGDADKLSFYTARAIDHLGFLLPDGAVDNSWGTRQNKWTYWGSRTSDGMHEGLVYVADRNPVIAKACIKNFELLLRCTSNGRLFGGPMYNSANEPACAHHAFDHAKSLAVWYLEANEAFENCEGAVLPREKEGIHSYQNGNLFTVTRGGFTATINACDTHIYPGSETGGGISLLWHKAYGAILAATPNRFVPTEMLNMQLQRHSEEELCHTPRLGNSDLDKSVVLLANGYTVTASSKSGGFEVSYDFGADSLIISISSETDTEYILPIVTESGQEIKFLQNETIFNNMLSVKSNGGCTVTPSDEERYFHPVGGFQYKHLTFPVKANTPLTVEISIN